MKWFVSSAHHYFTSEAKACVWFEEISQGLTILCFPEAFLTYYFLTSENAALAISSRNATQCQLYSRCSKSSYQIGNFSRKYARGFNNVTVLRPNPRRREVTCPRVQNRHLLLPCSFHSLRINPPYHRWCCWTLKLLTLPLESMDLAIFFFFF